MKEAVQVRTSADFENEEDKKCRFCWGEEENSKDDPLILACKCRGSVGLIHYQCLKNWISSQKQMKEYASDVTSYYWKKFECEICKQPYPYIFKSKDNLFKLIDNM
jgi:E3 ubiquitin-protein ligase DOA10